MTVGARTARHLFNVVKYGCMAHCLVEFTGTVVQCDGPSMSPTLKSRDLVLAERLSVGLRKIVPGDIVICKSPTKPGQQICKRVTALEGEYVTVSHGPAKGKMFYVPRGHVWLEGDNGDNSIDSCYYGAVPYGLITSRVFCRVWPPASLTNKQFILPTNVTRNPAVCDQKPTGPETDDE
ncbi:mitochondrial inner membrane protease subunit 1-like isoform X3 [Tubulanus polymorphus]